MLDRLTQCDDFRADSKPCVNRAPSPFGPLSAGACAGGRLHACDGGMYLVPPRPVGSSLTGLASGVATYLAQTILYGVTEPRYFVRRPHIELP